MGIGLVGGLTLVVSPTNIYALCHAVAEKIFFMYSHYKSMVGVACMDPRGTVDRIYTEE